MLEHSRGVSGERRAVDLNALIEEALNLAYHGARAQDASFNITLEREFDRGLAPTELAPQEMTRVFLNLFGNGFYATTKRQRDGAGALALGGGIEAVAEEVEEHPGHLLRRQLHRREAVVEFALQGDVEARILGRGRRDRRGSAPPRPGR